MSLGRILIFFGVIFGLTLGTHYYLWARLIRDPMLPSPWRQLATVALIVLAMFDLLLLAGELFDLLIQRIELLSHACNRLRRRFGLLL